MPLATLLAYLQPVSSIILDWYLIMSKQLNVVTYGKEFSKKTQETESGLKP